MTSKAIPMVRITAAFILGILLYNCLLLESTFFDHFICLLVAVISLITLLSFCFLKHTTSKSIILYALISLSGVICTKFHHVDKSYSNHFTKNTYKTLTGICEISNYSKNKPKLVLKIIQGTTEQLTTHKFLVGKIITYLDSCTTHTVSPGDTLTITSKYRAIRKRKNPSDFDYKGYMKMKGIEYSCFLKDADIINHIQGNDPLFSYYIRTLQGFISNSIEKYIPSQNHRAVTRAMVIGDKSQLSLNQYKAFSRTGAMHILAVSGLHVGIIAGLILYILNFLPQLDANYSNLKYLFAILFVWIYAFIANSSPSVIRASIMFSFFLIAKISSKHYNPFNILASSAFLMLLINPYQVYNIGFQFSYLAVLGILIFYPKLKAFIITQNKLLKYITEIVAVSIAAQSFIILPGLYYFNQTSMVSFISSIVAIPSAAIILSSSFGLILFDYFNLDSFARISAWLLNKTLNCLHATVDYLNQFQCVTIDNIEIHLHTLFYLFFIKAFILLSFFRKRTIYIVPVLMLLFLNSVLLLTDKINPSKGIVIKHNRDDLIIDFNIANETTTFHLNKPNFHQGSKKFRYTFLNGILLFDDYKIGILSQMKEEHYCSIKELDLIILDNNLDLQSLSQGCTVPLIIPSHINYHLRNQLLTKYNSLNIYDIKLEGAFIKNL